MHYKLPLVFDPQPESRTHLYRLSITSPDADTSNAVAAFVTPAVGDGELHHGPTTVPERRSRTVRLRADGAGSVPRPGPRRRVPGTIWSRVGPDER